MKNKKGIGLILLLSALVCVVIFYAAVSSAGKDKGGNGGTEPQTIVFINKQVILFVVTLSSVLVLVYRFFNQKLLEELLHIMK